MSERVYPDWVQKQRTTGTAGTETGGGLGQAFVPARSLTGCVISLTPGAAGRNHMNWRKSLSVSLWGCWQEKQSCAGLSDGAKGI